MSVVDYCTRLYIATEPNSRSTPTEFPGEWFDHRTDKQSSAGQAVNAVEINKFLTMDKVWHLKATFAMGFRRRAHHRAVFPKVSTLVMTIYDLRSVPSRKMLASDTAPYTTPEMLWLTCFKGKVCGGGRGIMQYVQIKISSLLPLWRVLFPPLLFLHERTKNAWSFVQLWVSTSRRSYLLQESATYLARATDHVLDPSPFVQLLV